MSKYEDVKDEVEDIIDDVKDELEDIVEDIKEEYDQFRLEVHLAGMEMRDEWQEVEKKWEKAQHKYGQVKKELGSSTEEIRQYFTLMGDELKESYKRIRKLF